MASKCTHWIHSTLSDCTVFHLTWNVDVTDSNSQFRAAFTVSFSLKKNPIQPQSSYVVVYCFFFLFFTFKIDHVSTSQRLSCNSACLFSYMRHFCGVEKICLRFILKRWLETYWCKIGRKKELYYIAIQTSFVHKMILDTLAAMRQTRFVRFKVKK